MKLSSVCLAVTWTLCGTLAFAQPPVQLPDAPRTTLLGSPPSGFIAYQEASSPIKDRHSTTGTASGELTLLTASPQAPSEKAWISAEYLYWWIKKGNLPALATVGPVEGQGVLGEPGTSVILGGSSLGDNSLSGGRFQGGLWLNCDQTCGIEAGYFFLAPHTDSFTATCPSGQVLGRPFFNVNSGLQDAELICLPGISDGSFRASLETSFQGGELNFATRLLRDCCLQVDFLGGFRVLSLEDNLSINESVRVAPGVPGFGGQTFHISDEFDAHTRFYGGQIGARGEFRSNRMWVNLMVKLGLGVSAEEMNIHGSTLTTAANGTRTANAGGLLALATNSGRFERQTFAVVPELGINFGYQVTEHLSAFAGYNVLFWSKVIRPGDQIDLALRETNIPTSVNFTPGLPGTPPPAFSFHESSFWAQGITFGLNYRF